VRKIYYQSSENLLTLSTKVSLYSNEGERIILTFANGEKNIVPINRLFRGEEWFDYDSPFC